ncbi:MAG: aminopeptidase P family N-terminal domain-containing protein, partial [Paracoccus sp. (in: a-proteobacteria)]
MSFQTFDDPAGGGDHAARLAALREALHADDLAGFIVPRADAHQGEYVADADARLAWLTGFTGSAGFAIIAPDRAGVFIDG